MEILGEGNDGIVAKFISPPDSRFPLYNCVKFYKQGVKPNTKITDTLKQLDTQNLRYAPYQTYPPNTTIIAFM